MGLDKYLLSGGDNLPAENVDSIDPDSITPQAAGYLTGGTSVSAMSVWDALFFGSNNGAFKINIDGTVYDNIAPSFVSISALGTISSDMPGNHYSTTTLYRTLTFSKKIKLDSFTMVSSGYNSGRTAKIEVRLNNSGGDLIATSDTVSFPSSPGESFTMNFTGDQRKILETGQNYCFLLVPSSSVSLESSSSSGDPYYTLGGYEASSAYDFSTIATSIQAAIRAVTSSLETVSYSTDHFIITSVTKNRASQILKLMAPTTGTDISGAGATKYLDCGTGATETQGTGSEYYLVRLGEEGSLPGIYISSETKTSGNFTIPRGCSRIVLSCDIVRSTYHIKGDIVLTTSGKTAGAICGSFITLAGGLSFLINGQTIETTNDSLDSWSVTAYYYRF